MSTCWQVILTSVEWRAPRVLRVRLAPFAGEQGEGAPLGLVGWGAFLAEPRHLLVWARPPGLLRERLPSRRAPPPSAAAPSPPRCVRPHVPSRDPCSTSPCLAA